MIFRSIRSFSSAFSQVDAWPPHSFFVYLPASASDCLAGVSLCRCSACPYHLSLLVLMVSLHFRCFVMWYRSSLDISFGHLMLMALLRSLLWNKSILLLVVLFVVHSSELYRNTLSVQALNTLIFVSTFRILSSKMWQSFLRALFASCFLLLMSSCVSSRLPNIFHFFHASSPWDLTLPLPDTHYCE